MLYELCALLLTILRPWGEAAEAGVASMALMFCGSLTLVLGFFLMPWVLGLACVFLFVGFVTNLSGIRRAIIWWPTACSLSSHKEGFTCLGGFDGHHQGGISRIHWTGSVNLLSYRTMKLPLTIPVLLALAALLSSTAAASQIPVHFCSGGNYTSASSYHRSLGLLSATLPQMASRAPSLYARDRVVTGEVTYALAQCRRDLDSGSCSSCIHEGLQSADVFCGLRKEAFLAYELCTLRLSGTVISWSASQMNVSASQPDTATVESSTVETGLDALAAGVASLAANTSQRFATAVEEVDADGRHYTAYGLAQCTPELTPAECAFCLEELRYYQMPHTLSRRSGGWFATSWCSYSVHLYKFFASEPLQHLPTVTSNAPSGDRKKKRRILVGVTVGASVAVLLILLSVIAALIVRRRRRAAQKTKQARNDEEAIGSQTPEDAAKDPPEDDTTTPNDEEAIGSQTPEDAAKDPPEDHTTTPNDEEAIGSQTPEDAAKDPPEDHTTTPNDEEAIGSQTPEDAAKDPPEDHTTTPNDEKAIGSQTPEDAAKDPPEDHTTTPNDEEAIGSQTPEDAAKDPTEDDTTTPNDEKAIGSQTPEDAAKDPLEDHTTTPNDEKAIGSQTPEDAAKDPPEDHTTTPNDEEAIGSQTPEDAAKDPTEDDTTTPSEEPTAELKDPTEEHATTSDAPTGEHSVWEACPSALDFFDEMIARAQAKKIVLFLDYDGTLSKIVSDPAKADITEPMRRAVKTTAESFSTSIVTGRDVPKAIGFVKLDNLNYAGSHGLDIKICGEEHHYQPFPYLEPLVTKATESLKEALRGISGASVENNKFCVSAHYRNVDEKDWDLAEAAVRAVLEDFPQLRLETGKMVWEFRTKEVFTKGDAVEYLLRHLVEHQQMDRSRVLAIHIGDDKTDEDAFKMLLEQGCGFGIVVTTEPKPTRALYSLRDPPEVMEFLERLVRWKAEEDGIVEF